MSEVNHAVDPRTDAPACPACETDLCVARRAHGGWTCERCNTTIRNGTVRDYVPEGEVVYYLPGKSGTTYHHTRACLNLKQSDREVLEWTPEIAHRTNRDPCGTCAQRSESDETADDQTKTQNPMSSDSLEPGMDASEFLDEDGNVDLGQIRAADSASRFDRKTVTRGLCETFRREIANGMAAVDIVDKYDNVCAASTLRKHVRGECHHSEARIDEPTATYTFGEGWSMDE